MCPVATGPELFDLVERYAALGDHRTGTPVDDATRDLVAQELEARGATVERVPYAFERYESRARVVAGGEPVPCVPLYYSGVGDVTSDAPFLARLEMLGGMVAIDLDAHRGEARARGAEVAVLATGDADGRLVAENVAPVLDEGPPIVLVAGADHDRVAVGPGRVEVGARLVPGHSETVVGRFGPDAPQSFVVTTPLTGWFECAGERGTGIAVALDVAAALADDGDTVLVVATTGHELEHPGARHWLRRHALQPRAVLHCGASLAAGDVALEAGPDLSSMRVAMTNVAEHHRERLVAALEPAKLPVVAGPDTWGGEGEDWRRFGVPLLSCTGGFEGFHTPDDLPERVTSPAALETVRDAVLAAARTL